MSFLAPFRGKILHKTFFGKQRYLVFLGLRIPYDTHVEEGLDVYRKYIHIFGIEFCYRKYAASPEAVNTCPDWYYDDNLGKESFFAEEKITPEMQLVHVEQKAYKQLGYFPDLINPRTLNEKVMRLALKYRNPLISPLSNKATAKKWIAEQVGEQYVVPTIGVYERVGEINFGDLPDQFVAKFNGGWDGSKVLIIRDKKSMDVDRVKAILSSWLYPWNDYYYKNLCITDEKKEKPLIVIEKYLCTGEGNSLKDYKIFCCNGEPRFAYVWCPEGNNPRIGTMTFVDMEWNILPMSRADNQKANEVVAPQKKDEMIALARILSKPFPLVRVDFYEVEGRVYVGEMTFYPGMFGKIEPVEWDYILGEYVELPDQEDGQ